MWIWVLVLCAAVALVSPALAVRRTSTTVPATRVKMPEHAKMALKITPAPVYLVSLVKTAAFEQTLVSQTHASMGERATHTSLGQCVSVCLGSWVQTAIFLCREVWS